MITLEFFIAKRRLLRCLTAAAMIIASGAVSLYSATIFPSFTSPQMRSGIPVRNYQYGLRSSVKNATSTTTLLLEIPRPTNRQPDGLLPKQVHNRVRVFQLPIEKLEIRDRKISRVAFYLEKNGAWSLSLQGDFHEHVDDRTEPFIDAHHKRCRFRVKVRCFGGYPVGESAANLTTGKPVLFQTGPVEFWVQSGQPFDMWTRGNVAEANFARNYLELINRVEVEFSYDEPAGVSRAVGVTPPA